MQASRGWVPEPAGCIAHGPPPLSLLLLLLLPPLLPLLLPLLLLPLLLCRPCCCRMVMAGRSAGADPLMPSPTSLLPRPCPPAGGAATACGSRCCGTRWTVCGGTTGTARARSWRCRERQASSLAAPAPSSQTPWMWSRRGCRRRAPRVQRPRQRRSRRRPPRRARPPWQQRVPAAARQVQQWRAQARVRRGGPRGGRWPATYCRQKARPASSEGWRLGWPAAPSGAPPW